MDFKRIFEKTPEETKLKFLDAIIKHNEGLQQKFINFTKQEDTTDEPFSLKSFIQHITETQQKYREFLESVNLEEPDWDSYNPPHSGYIEEWEQYQQASEQEFEQIFEEFKSEVIDMLIQQQIDDFTAKLLGLYEACLDAEIEDDVGSFHDVNEHLTEEHKRIMLELIEKIKLSAISSHKVNTAIQLFINYCDEEYPGNPSFPNYFEPLILALADISDQPGKILSFIDKSKIEREALPQLVLLLNRNAGNNKEWLQSAQQYYLTDNEVAKQLLDYYFENDKNSFVKTADELFNIDKPYWSEWLELKISLEMDKTLFFKVFYQRTISAKEIAHYNRIRELLSPFDFEQLLSEVKWDLAFVVKILEVEKKFEEIKQIVEDNPDSWYYKEIISPILPVYPAFCFNSIKSKAKNTLEKERGRRTYKRIASWLAMAKEIPGFEAQTRKLILQLYNHKPNLPALKDEFREAGLV